MTRVHSQCESCGKRFQQALWTVIVVAYCFKCVGVSKDMYAIAAANVRAMRAEGR